MNEITCRDCGNCYLKTLVCQEFNKSVADNSVHAWECPKFTPRKQAMQIAFHVPPSMRYASVIQRDGQYSLVLVKKKCHAEPTP